MLHFDSEGLASAAGASSSPIPKSSVAHADRAIATRPDLSRDRVRVRVLRCARVAVLADVAVSVLPEGRTSPPLLQHGPDLLFPSRRHDRVERHHQARGVAGDIQLGRRAARVVVNAPANKRLKTLKRLELLLCRAHHRGAAGSEKEASLSLKESGRPVEVCRSHSANYSVRSG